MDQKGFTLIETLLAIVIMGIAVGLVSLSFPKLESSQVLDKSSSLVVSVLNEARSLTLSGKSDSQYGVYFQDDQLALFRGSTYATSTSDNVFTTLNSLVGIRNISLSGGSSRVLFDRLTGATSQAGSLEVYLRSDTASYKRVTISSTGVIEED